MLFIGYVNALIKKRKKRGCLFQKVENTRPREENRKLPVNCVSLDDVTKGKCASEWRDKSATIIEQYTKLSLIDERQTMCLL